MKNVLVGMFAVCLASCTPLPNGTTTSTTATEQDASPTPIVITQADDIPRHLGKIVTLRGQQTRSKIPYVLGIVVDGDDRLADEIVEVTGRLGSYETTQAEVDAFDARQREQPFAAPRPAVGTHYTLSDPATGEACKSRLWRPSERGGTGASNADAD
jgi:hypothetical protein